MRSFGTIIYYYCIVNKECLHKFYPYIIYILFIHLFISYVYLTVRIVNRIIIVCALILQELVH